MFDELKGLLFFLGFLDLNYSEAYRRERLDQHLAVNS